MDKKRIAVLGAGNMGAALLRGILASGWGRRGRLTASHPKAAKAAALAKELGIRVVASNLEAARSADIVILAVKPQILESVLGRDPAGDLARAARRVDRGRVSDGAHRGDRRAERVPVVRAMPNVAAVVRLSATVLCAGRHATARPHGRGAEDLRVDRPGRRAARVSARRGDGPLRQRPDVRLPDHRGPVGRRRARRASRGTWLRRSPCRPSSARRRWPRS